MTIGLEVEFYEAGTDSELAFHLLWLIYFVELVLRILVDGLSVFRVEGVHCNLFDFSLVVLMGADELVEPTDSLVDILKLLRMCRIFRLVRMVRLIPSMKHTVYLMWASMGSFGWTALLMLLIMYGFALFFTEVSASFLEDAEKLDVTNDRIVSLQANWGHEDVSGSVSFHEFCAHCDDDGVLTFCKTLDIHPDQAREMFQLLDKEAERIERRVQWLNQNLSLSCEIDPLSMLPTLETIGFWRPMCVLSRLEETSATDLAHPNELIRNLVGWPDWVGVYPETICEDTKIARRRVAESVWMPAKTSQLA